MSRLVAISALALATLAAPGSGPELRRDPFAFFAPSAATRSGDRELLLDGGTIARVVSGSGHAVAVFSATAVNANGDRLLAWMRNIPAFKKSDHVRAIGRFSNPPRLDDLAALALDPGDIEDVRRCRTGHCPIKLAAGEIQELQRAGDIQDAFHLIVLRRIVRDSSGSQRYLEYLNRSDIDVLAGMWSGLVRRILERRVRTEAPAVLTTLRYRLESGDPPAIQPGASQ